MFIAIPVGQIRKAKLQEKWLIKLLVSILFFTIAWDYIERCTLYQQSLTVRVRLFKRDNLEKAIIGMKETNDLLINWAIILLGGTVGIAILGKGAKIRDRNWGMTAMPAIWLFLLWGSLKNGYDFKRSLTFQLARGDYSFPELNFHLYLQLHFFQMTLYGLGLWAVVYLVFRFALMEEKLSGGD